MSLSSEYKTNILLRKVAWALLLLLSFFKVQAKTDTTQIMAQLKQLSSVTKSNPDSIIEHLNSIISQSGKIHFNKGLSTAYHIKGKILVNKGSYAHAKIALDSALYYNTRNENLAAIYNDKGNAHNYSEDFEKASVLYIKAIELSDRYPNVNFPVSNTYFNLCTIFDQLGKTGKLKYYIQKGREIADSLNEQEAVANFIMLDALFYYRHQNYTKAIDLIDSSIAHSRKFNKARSLYSGLSNKAIFCIDTKKYNEALDALFEARSLVKTFVISLENEVSVLITLADVYMELKQPENADKYLKQAVALSRDLPREQVVLLKKISEFHQLSGNYKQALHYLNEYLVAKDSTDNIVIARNIDELETLFRTEEKDKNLAQKESFIAKQNEQIARKNLWIGAFVFMISVMALMGFVWKKQQKAKASIAALALEADHLKAKIEGEEEERSRLAQELHDGVNSKLAAANAYLSSLAVNDPELSKKNAYVSGVDIIKSAAQELRQISHNLLPAELMGNSLDEAVAVFVNQVMPQEINVELQRYGNFSGLPVALSLSLFRMVQELIQNVIRHAQATEVILILNRAADHIHITVEDNGIGIPEKYKAGLGLKSIEKRVAALKGEISVESQKHKGTVFYISVPD